MYIDWTSCPDNFKSVFSYVFSLGTSREHELVAKSTFEAEYVYVASATNQALWFQRLLGSFGFKPEKPTHRFCDNKAASVFNLV